MEKDKVLYNTASGKFPPHPVSKLNEVCKIWRSLLTFPLISMEVDGRHRTPWKKAIGKMPS